jgi:hypothetical protein
VKKVKNYFGRVLRDIGRGICGRDDRLEWFTNLMELGRKAGEIFVDKGYRGHDYEGSATVHVAKRGMKKLSAALRKWMRRRAAIEPVIGHIKNDGRLGRNYLKGAEGDRMNAVLSGCGYNMRKLLRWLLFLLFSARPVVQKTVRIGDRLDAPSNVAA